MTEPDHFPRQPQPVKVTFGGDPQDIETYITRLCRLIEDNSFDNVTRTGNTITIYPAAVND